MPGISIESTIYPTCEVPRLILLRLALLFWCPDNGYRMESEVAARLEEILECTPITELIIVTQLPGLDPAKARRSLDWFGAEVPARMK
jgi:hypothetical protein